MRQVPDSLFYTKNMKKAMYITYKNSKTSATIKGLKKNKNIMCRSEQKQERNIPHGQKQR